MVVFIPRDDVERCLPAAAGTKPTRSEPLEGSRFYPDPFAGTLLKPPRLLGGRVRAGGSRERLQTPLQPAAIHFVYYLQHDKAKPHRGTFPGAARYTASQKYDGCLRDQLRLRATFKSGSPPRFRPSRPRPAAAGRQRSNHRSLLTR